MTRMKGMLLATALMIAAAQSNDPFRTPRRNTGVRRNDWIVSGNKHYCSKECYNEDKGRNRSAQKNV